MQVLNIRFRPLSASLVFHIIVIATLLSIRFAPRTPHSRPLPQTLTYVAPLLKPPVLKPPSIKPRPVAAGPRVFQPAAAPSAAKIEVQASPRPPELSAPLPAVAPAPAAIAETLPSPPRVIKIDNLPEAAAPPSPRAPAAEVRAAGFLAAQTSSNSGNTRGALTTGSFAAVRTSDAAKTARSTSAAGFGDASVAAPSVASRTLAQPAPATAVEILSKPKPIYTDEARRRRIEGEVALDVLFTAAGSARVLRVIRGLGHGLDEAAIVAAENIRFRPALRSGQPVDSSATVHIIFQLAY